MRKLKITGIISASIVAVFYIVYLFVLLIKGADFFVDGASAVKYVMDYLKENNIKEIDFHVK